VFESWVASGCEEGRFDVEALREQRLRGLYQTRYDHRVNLMDWTYTMHIKPLAPIIHWLQYKQFCLTGVSFETRLAPHTHPNPTLAAYIPAKDRRRQQSVLVRGYWGDVVNSPFMSFGIDTDTQDKDRLWRTVNKEQRHNAQEVSKFNLTAWLNELETHQPFHLPPERHEESEYPYPSPLDSLNPKVEELELDDTAPVSRQDGATSRLEVPSGLSHVKIVFLTGDLPQLLSKTRYGSKFDLMYFGNLAVSPLFGATNLLNKPAEPTVDDSSPAAADDVMTAADGAPRAEWLTGAMKPQCRVVVESFKYMVHYKPSVRLRYRSRLLEAARRMNWTLANDAAAPPAEFDACVDGQGMKEPQANEVEAKADTFMVFEAAMRGDGVADVCADGREEGAVRTMAASQ